MQQPHQRKWLVFWLCFALVACGLFMGHAALFDLDAYVTFSILDEFGSSLPDGALVYIIGSSTNVVLDPGGMDMVQGTNFLASSTQSNEVFLGSVRIGDNNTSNGTFFTTVQYDPLEVEYAYIRYFNFTNDEPVTGLVYWGTSAVFQLVPTLGVARVDFSDNNNLVVQQINNFVVIPEPGTGNLMLLFFAMLGGIRARMKRQEKEEAGRRDAGTPIP